ncbi:MAG TPA: YfcE family phosphodiesterase [Desulfuromonadaceae bacterium]
MVISDTHGNYPLVIKACDAVDPLDAIIHLGDGDEDAALLAQLLDVPVINVAGNCDCGSSAPRELLWECEGKRLLLTHGDLYGVKKRLGRLEKRGFDFAADIILFGHTHHAVIITLAGITFINPGSLVDSTTNPSYAVLDVTPAGIAVKVYPII